MRKINMRRFVSTANTLVNKLEEHFEKLPDKGDKCCDSQKICLLNALYDVEKNINGLEPEDFIEEDES